MSHIRTDVNTLPESWATRTASEVCEKIQDGTHFSPKRQSHIGQFAYVTAKNVRPSGLDLSDLTYLCEDEHRPIFQRCDVAYGDVLLVKDGVNAGDAALNTLTSEISLLSSVCFLRTRNGVLSPSFLRYFLLSPQGASLLTRELTGTAIRRIILQRIRELTVPIAPMAEQDRIVQIIESLMTRLDSAVASLQKVQTKLKAYRASVLKAAVEGRLVPTEAEIARREGRDFEPGSVLLARILKERRRRWEEAELARMKKAGKTPKDDAWKTKYQEPEAPDTSKLPPLPEAWCWASVDQLSAEVFYGTSAKTSATGDIPVLRMGNIVDGQLDLADLKYLPATHDEFPALLLRDGDLLFNRTNSAELVGKTAVYRCQPPIASFASYLICVRLLNLPTWISHVINSPYGRFWVSDVAVQQVGQANVNGTKLKALAIPLPPHAEQERLLGHIDELITNAEASSRITTRELLRIGRLRQSVLKWAFEGKLVDQDPNDEPAEELLARIRAERAAAPTTKTRGRKAKSS